MNEGDSFNVNCIKSALKLKLEDIFKQEWNQRVQENSQCVTACLNQSFAVNSI